MSVAPHHELLLRQFDEAAPALRAAGDALVRDLAAWIADEPGLKVHSVTARVKRRESLAGKLSRPERSYGHLWDVTDLLGLRVIVYFEDSVDRIARLLERRLSVALEHSVDKRRRAAANAFGYRSVHYVCRIEAAHARGMLASLPPPPALSPSPCFEVQVRTVLEHAWAEIEHDLGYKSNDAIPEDARRRLSRLAGLLELADQEFLAIRGGLESYARSLPGRIEAAADPVPLDLLSLGPLLDCAEVREADLAIADLLGVPLGEQPFFPPYLLKMLAMTGLRTVLVAREGVRDHAARITSLVRPYFAFASRTWSLSPEQMQRLPRGYSLFFLAHCVVLGASTLRLDKVARLTDLYRELDHPHDERVAQQVAGMLVDAFDVA